MGDCLKSLLKKFLPLIDLLCVIPVYLSGIFLKLIRSVGVHRLPRVKSTLTHAGVFPIRDHYYEPLFNPDHLTKSLNESRNLPGINWNLEGQLALLEQFRFGGELADVPLTKPAQETVFYINNGAYEAGDAEYWYNLIRLKKPQRIFEIGSGNSTLVATKALGKNKEEDPAYSCRHVCIEPYEMPWLEKTPVEVLRKKAEDVDPSFFSELGNNDILFIDSSHMIRPQGDVLFEYLELIPSLNPGVIVHVHDIFSPRDYPPQWVVDEVRFWNEQYLLEGFLTANDQWKIIGALNYLRHNHFDRLKSCCPFLDDTREPGSFYIQKNL